MYFLAESLTEELAETEELSFFEEMFATFDWSTFRREAFFATIRILFALVVFFIVYKIAKWFIELFFERYFKSHTEVSNRYQTIYRVTNNIFNAIFYFFLIYTILEILSFPVGTLLASAGVVGLAISFGAQGFVSDLVNGFTIISEKQLDIGDEVVIDDVSGTVINMNLRTTNVKDFDGTIHFIPNREITIISNRSKGDMRAMIEIRLFPDTDIEKVRAIVAQVNQNHIENYPEITVPPSDIIFASNAKNQMTLRVIMYTKAGAQYGIMNTFYSLYVSEITKQGIELPYGDIDIV